MSTLDAVHSALELEFLQANGNITGIGIDYEPWRESADLRTSRFFLLPTEQVHATDARSLLRLWTVKEALFKATPHNGNATLLQYEIAEPGTSSGWARGPHAEQIRYVSVDLDSGPLAVAACLARGDVGAAVRG